MKEKTTNEEMNQVLKEMIQEGKETFFEDPNIQNSYFLGSRAMVTIVFA